VEERVKWEGKRVGDNTAKGQSPLPPLPRPGVGSAPRSHPAVPLLGSGLEREQSLRSTNHASVRARTVPGSASHDKTHPAQFVPGNTNRCHAQSHPCPQQHRPCQAEGPFSHCLVKQQTPQYAELPQLQNSKC